jgi:dTDP-4-amino-4,6-dideoxygalactose transaminase
MMTAINIGDMVKIVEEHGLVPVPVDLDPYTMAPTLE